MARAGLAIALCAAACTPSFQSASDVLDLRVLAIRAEPPEAFVDLDGGTVEPVEVRVLVADPRPRRGLSVSAAVCLPTDTRRCDEGQRLDLPPQQGGDPGERRFRVEVPAPLVVAALQDDRLKGLGGIRVQFSVTVDDGDPNGPVAAEKTLLYSAVPEEAANHNPDIAAVDVFREDGTTERLGPGGTIQLGRFEQVGVRPVPGEGAAGPESYVTTDLQGREVRLREQLQYSFFSTSAAEWDRDRADEPLPELEPPAGGIARLRSVRAGTGTFWIVVRDGRGGLGWIEGSLNALE